MKKIIISSILVLVSLYYLSAYFLPSNSEKELYGIFQILLSNDEKNKDLDLFSFDWDRFEFISDQNPNSLGPQLNITKYLQQRNISYDIWNVISIPKIENILGLEDECRSAFIFLKNNKLKRFYCLSDSIKIADTSYHFAQSNFISVTKNVFIAVDKKKPASLLLRESLGVDYTAEINFAEE